MILAKIVDVIQHTRSCSSIYWAAICIYFINQPYPWYIAFDKCFYNCDVVVERSLYIAFLIINEKSLHSKVMHNELVL